MCKCVILMYNKITIKIRKHHKIYIIRNYVTLYFLVLGYLGVCLSVCVWGCVYDGVIIIIITI